MGKLFSKIDDSLRTFIESQRMFFVATAPSGADGHVNLSPKGLDSFRILGPTSIAYLDFVGSGAETIAHLRENGRIVIMFCAFEGPPKIVRFYGRGRAIEKPDPEFSELIIEFSDSPMARSIIQIDVTRIADSCGYAVPLYDFKEDRKQLVNWADRKGSEEIEHYQRTRNAESIDGLPALRWVQEET